MKSSRTKFGAFAAYLCSRFRLQCVQVSGGFVVTETGCETCRHKDSNHTPLCVVPSSVGCDDWELKGCDPFS